MENLKPTLYSQVISLLYPVRCLGCQQEGDWICSDCLPQLVTDTNKTCRACHQEAQSGLCQSCQKKLGIKRLVSLYPYSNPLIQQLIAELKFKRHSDVLNFLKNIIHPIVTKQFRGQYTVTYIPIHPVKERLRGFNQSELLAKAFFSDQQQIQKLLRKTRPTEPQSSLNKRSRAHNLTNSITAIGQVPKKVILVDDVVTTGATIKEAALALREAGATEISVVTLAHG